MSLIHLISTSLSFFTVNAYKNTSVMCSIVQKLQSTIDITSVPFEEVAMDSLNPFQMMSSKIQQVHI